MIAIRLPELKPFTAQLFLQNTFHPFLVCEASFQTGCGYVIDGKRNAEYYGPDDALEEAYVSWEELRPVCFQIIRGSRLPLQFKIVLRTPKAFPEKLAASAGADFSPEQVEAFHLIIQYRDGKITCTTGTSFALFTLDKTADQLWDRYVLQFLDRHKIAYAYL